MACCTLQVVDNRSQCKEQTISGFVHFAHQCVLTCRQYVHAMKGVRSLLLTRISPAPDGLLYSADRWQHKQPTRESDIITCVHLEHQCVLTCRQYVHAMKGVRSLLLTRTSPAPDGLLYIAERKRRKGAKEPKMDHLVCFLPGKQTHGQHAESEPTGLETAQDLTLAVAPKRRVMCMLNPLQGCLPCSAMTCVRRLALWHFHVGNTGASNDFRLGLLN